MKPKSAIFSALFLLFILVAGSTGVSAQKDSDAYTKTLSDIESTLGLVPSFFKVFPKSFLPGAWDYFKTLNGPETAINAKNKELIGLAVAAQIPCHYCIYFHTAAASANGASDEEIQEAIAIAASTRHWSTVLNGSQLDFEAFKKEFNTMMDFMAEKAASAAKK